MQDVEKTLFPLESSTAKVSFLCVAILFGIEMLLFFFFLALNMLKEYMFTLFSDDKGNSHSL